jgi:hypothetical protein
MLRGFGCTVYFCKDGKLVYSGHSACWSMIRTAMSARYDKEIYISDYDCKETRECQQLLIGLINQITPCSIVKVKGGIFSKERECIKFKLMKTYDQSLVLLNFIRNLWHEPQKGYAAKFFESLITSGLEKHDPLARLTLANKQACPSGMVYGPGHSNVHGKSKLKIKEAVDLIKYRGYSTAEFLTS